jgi:hypothetical protein
MQQAQGGFRGQSHAMHLASGPQAGQPNLAQGNPSAQQQFLQQQQQQNMQRISLGLSQQQQQQQQSQLASGGTPGMGGLQHPGLAGANQAHMNNLAHSNNPALLSLIGMGGNGMGQPNNHLIPGLLRNPNVLDLHNRSMLEPSMSDQVSVLRRVTTSALTADSDDSQLQAMQRARQNLNQAQGGAGAAANQHIRLPSNEHNSSPLLTAPHDQNTMMQQSLNRSPQPGNPGHPPSLSQQTPQSVAIIHKLDSMPLRELEMRVATWRDNLPTTEARVHEFLNAVQRPGATPEIQAAFVRAKQDYEQHKFLFIKSQEILSRKQAQLHQGQNSARMTPTNVGEPNRPGRCVAKPLSLV